MNIGFLAKLYASTLMHFAISNLLLEGYSDRFHMLHGVTDLAGDSVNIHLALPKSPKNPRNYYGKKHQFIFKRSIFTLHHLKLSAGFCS